MKGTNRIYYVGEGDMVALPDGKEVLCAKVIPYGGGSFIWAPPGKKIEKQYVSYENPHLYDLRRHKAFVEKRKMWVVTGDGGAEQSFQDLSDDQWLAVQKSGKANGLMTEEDYFKVQQPDDIQRRIDELVLLKKQKEVPAESVKKVELPKNPGRPTKSNVD